MHHQRGLACTAASHQYGELSTTFCQRIHTSDFRHLLFSIVELHKLYKFVNYK